MYIIPKPNNITYKNEEVYKIFLVDKLEEDHLQPRKRIRVPPQYRGGGAVATPNLKGIEMREVSIQHT